MSHTSTIMNPVASVELAGERIEVRELRWPEALGLLQEISLHVGRFVTAEGRLRLSPDDLPKLIQESASLAEHLILKATGKDAAWLRGLTPAQAFVVLDPAIALNLSPELFARGKAIAGRLQAAFGGTPAGDPSTSCSPNAATT